MVEVLARKICNAYLDSNTVIIKDIPKEKVGFLVESVQKNLLNLSHEFDFIDFYDLVNLDLVDAQERIFASKNLVLNNFFLRKDGVDDKKIVFVNFLLRQHSLNHGGFQKQLVFFSPNSEMCEEDATNLFSKVTGIDAKRHPYLSWGNIYSLK